jgi:hypothetical protein
MHADRRFVAALLALVSGVAAAEASAQDPDSLAALRRARSEQAAFERFRFQRLPTTISSGAGPCTERIGRWCFWFAPGSADRTPVDPPAVVERRGRLIHTLAGLADAAPAEPWIVGQLIRYLVEGGDLEGAMAAARSCEAERWWCLALEGYAFHAGERWAEAERTFAAALAAMPGTERARWTDPTLLLRDDDRRRLRRMEPARRAEAERRLWWLADPLWSQPGNDRRSEHLTRWTIARMQERARQVDATPWGDDSREILLRYGWFTGWERMMTPFSPGTSSGVIAHTADLSWEFLTPLGMAVEPATLRDDVWPLDATAATATRYAPPYARRMLSLHTQRARFRRVDGDRLVIGYELPADSLPAGAALRAAAVAMSGPDGPRTDSRWTPTGTSGAFFLELPGGTPIVSVEVLEDSTRRLARWRGPVPEPAERRISDLLLLAHEDARPAELLEAARIARGSARVRAGERVAVFWEVYDVPPDDSLSLRVALIAPRGGWTRRRLQALGLASPPRPVRLRVQEESPGGAVVARSLAVALPGDLRPGDHVLEITVQARGFPAATARRVLTVVR